MAKGNNSAIKTFALKGFNNLDLPEKIAIIEDKILMTSDSTSTQLFANLRVNFTSIPLENTLVGSNNNLGFYSYSSSDTTSNDLTTNYAEQQQLNSNASAANYSFNSGYGLVNAAAAVAQAIGQNAFANVPNLGGNNWGADMIKAPEAWAKGYTGQGVVVAVLDTGVDYNHVDLKDNIWTNPQENKDGYTNDLHGWNFVDNNNDVLDNNGHGTHVSGIIAGENNNFGVTGIAYNAKIMPVKVLDDSGSGSTTNIANGIYYAVNHGANVINLSLGSNFSDSTLQSAIEYASNKNVVVVMAAGNDGLPITSYPAEYADKWGLAVGAVDRNNNLANFSNRPGFSQLDYVTAPGVDIYSSIPGNQYASYSGTSMATPYVSGVVALMFSANHNLTEAQVRQMITQTAGNSTTQAQIPNLNLNSLASQIVAQIPQNITPSTISSFNISYITQSHTATLDWNSISKVQSNDLFANSENWLQLRDYDSSLGTENLIASNQDDTDTDTEAIVNKRKQNLE